MPRAPITLPPLLRQFLVARPFAMIPSLTSDGMVLVIKAADADVESCRGSMPVMVRYELHQTRHGPLIRLLLVVQDQPESHLTFETFCNVQDASQLDEWRDLLSRSYLRVLFYDSQLTHRFSKRVTQPVDQAARSLLSQARRLVALVDPRDLDFDKAKEQVMAENPL